MRTSFKHHQLRTMKSYFAINHNPDAKDLKQLSQKTGLPKRVLQVSIFPFVCFIFSSFQITWIQCLDSGRIFKSKWLIFWTVHLNCNLICFFFFSIFFFSFSLLLFVRSPRYCWMCKKVWFQNARAKWRRMMMKQDGKGSDKGDGSLDLDSYSHSPTSFIMGVGPPSPNSID